MRSKVKCDVCNRPAVCNGTDGTRLCGVHCGHCGDGEESCDYYDGEPGELAQIIEVDTCEVSS